MIARWLASLRSPAGEGWSNVYCMYLLYQADEETSARFNP